MPNRSSSGYAQFIPLTAKISPLSTVIDNNRKNITLTSSSPRTQVRK